MNSQIHYQPISILIFKPGISTSQVAFYGPKHVSYELVEFNSCLCVIIRVVACIINTLQLRSEYYLNKLEHFANQTLPLLVLECSSS